MLTRSFELAAFVFGLVEQSRILNRQHRLRAKGLQQIDNSLWKLARLLATDHERADDPVRASQRDGQQGTEASTLNDGRAARSVTILAVGRLHRVAVQRRLTDQRFA